MRRVEHSLLFPSGEARGARLNRKHARSASRSNDESRSLCLITHARYPIGEPRAERAANAARDAGYRVHVVALRERGELGSETIDGIHVRRLPIRHVRGRGLLRIAFEYLAFTVLATAVTLSLRRKRPLHVVQVHAPPDFLVLAGLLPRLLGAQLVLDVRDLSPHLWAARFGRRPGARVMEIALWLMQRAASAAAHRVITIHDPYREQLASHGVREDKITVVMNTPDETLVEKARTAGGSRDKDEFHLGYHGTITEWYGVDLMIRAVAELRSSLPGVRATILGDGDALPAAIELAHELGVADRITFSGCYLPISEALSRMRDVDCGVIPNLPTVLNRFSLSNKLFEYVWLGVPVVTARLETVAKYFSSAEVTFFEPGDVASLARAITWVSEHPEEAQAKAARARRRANAYRWREQRERYLSLLDQPPLPARG